MATYKALFKPSADRQLRKLPEAVQRRIVSEVESLAANPRPPGAAKLSGTENLWPIRIGDYRVVYEIDDERLIVLVLRVAHPQRRVPRITKSGQAGQDRCGVKAAVSHFQHAYGRSNGRRHATLSKAEAKGRSRS